MPIAGPKLERPICLAKLLGAGLQKHPDGAALVLFDRCWSWRELDEDSSRLAAKYLALGLAAGDRIASLLPNRGELIVNYLACCKAGLVATPLNYRYQTPEIDHALAVSGASLIVAHAERDESLAESEQVPRLRLGRITFEATGGPHRHLEEMMTENGPHMRLAPPPPDAPVFIFFTSGSTGKPKGVTHTHTTFGWLVASAVAGLGIMPSDVFLPATSASHVACSSLSLAGLAAGAQVVLARSFGPDELLPLIRRTRPTLLCSLPMPLFGLARDPSATRADFECIRRCISGGDKIAAELEEEYTALTGHAIEEVYGMTETGTVTFNPTGAGNRLGSIGQLAPGYTASIRVDERGEVPTGATGRLWIHSPSNMIGYWNRPDATAETIQGGWLDTGDLVHVDGDDFLWFHGRRKQIIIHDGSNICPQEVEESLLAHPAVAEACVIGIHDTVHGENVRAYITFRPEVPGPKRTWEATGMPSAVREAISAAGRNAKSWSNSALQEIIEQGQPEAGAEGAMGQRLKRPTWAELIQFSKARVGYKAPDEIIVLDQMPTNAVGKLDRAALKAMAEAGH